MKIKVFNLLGGFFGSDGYFTSAGMFSLASQINANGYDCETYTWNNYAKVMSEVVKLDLLKTKIVLIGYSGGGSRCTWIADKLLIPIDLMITYDPSPSWQMKDLRSNVKKAITYHNNLPLMLGLGGGVLKGPNVETVEISIPHAFVQLSQKLHSRTIQEIEKLASV